MNAVVSHLPLEQLVDCASEIDVLIRNYGLFWKAEDVFWGKQGVEGHLKGNLATNLTDAPIDFRHQIGIYVLYGDYKMIYVGQAGANDQQRIFSRLKQHKRDQLSGRWNQFSWFGLRRVLQTGLLAVETEGAQSTRGDVLNYIEAILIHSAEPPHNRQGGRYGENVEQYVQFRDSDALGPTQSEMLRALWSENQKLC